MPSLERTHSGPACTLWADAAALTTEIVRIRRNRLDRTRQGTCSKKRGKQQNQKAVVRWEKSAGAKVAWLTLFVPCKQCKLGRGT